MAPGGSVGIPHVHPLQQSHFKILSGSAWIRSAGQTVVLGPGETFTVPPRTPHFLWNEGDSEVHLIIEFRPGLLKQEFFETTFGLARDGMSYPNGLGNLFQRAVLTAAFRNESRPLGQRRLLRLGLLLLAPLGWLLGYRAHYARYCTRPDPPGGLPNTSPAA